MSNKSARLELIRLYGSECFIEKLHLRSPEDGPRYYTSKGQYKRMKQLTYHHIKEKSKGGKATVENGALLSAENHEWFNRQSGQVQAQINRAFQEYKRAVNIAIMQGATIKEARQIEFDLSDCITIPLEKDNEKYNRAKAKRELRKIIDEEMEM